MEVQTTQNYHYLPTGMAKIKLERLAILSAGEGEKQPALSNNIAGKSKMTQLLCQPK